MLADIPKISAPVAESQALKYADAVGRHTEDSIDDLIKFVKDAQPPSIYKDHSDVKFRYEVLEKKGWETRVKEIVMHWIEVSRRPGSWIVRSRQLCQNPANIQRASASVERAPTGAEFGIVCGYCLFCLKKSVPEPAETTIWKSMWKPDGLGVHGYHDEAVVFIALDDLGPENGFFMTLKSGQHVCVDSQAEILFPDTGGGRGIMFALRL